MCKVVFINGKGKSGKDTFIDICAEILNERVLSIDSVIFVKKAAKILGWNGEKDNKSRKFLSDLKKLSVEYNNQPLDYLMFSILKEKEKNNNTLIFLHIREPEEIYKMIEKLEENSLEYHTLLMIRDEMKLNNCSDDEVNLFQYDYIILNDKDLIFLKNKAREFLKKIGVYTND